MNVCDDKITKLKERIKSELPVYSSEQINRSREVTFECVITPKSFAKPQNQGRVFNSPLKEGELRKVFQDQTERAILQSKQANNMILYGEKGIQKKEIGESKKNDMKKEITEKDGNCDIENQYGKMRGNVGEIQKKEKIRDNKKAILDLEVLKKDGEEVLGKKNIAKKVYLS